MNQEADQTNTLQSVPHGVVAEDSEHQPPKVWFGDDGIMRIDFGYNGRITTESVQYAHEYHLSVTPEPAPILCLSQRVVHADYKALRLARSPEYTQCIGAIALVTGHFLAEFFAQQFLNYHRPTYPAKAFRDEQKALQWLNEVYPAQTQKLAQPSR